MTPNLNEKPSLYADRLGVNYTSNVSILHKKSRGQFFTPIPIASLMASFCEVNSSKIKILDAGCGLGILSCTLIEHLSEKRIGVKEIELIAYETDLELLKYAEKALNYLKKWLIQFDIKLNFKIDSEDFILKNAHFLKENNNSPMGFDVIISNPPYFKLSKDDDRTLAANDLVSGQPNIYSIFMGIAAKMLREDGELIFITPRSFASGNYFKAFRRLFFNTVQIGKIHLFNSRKDTFNRDKVLQETVIIKAVKEKINPNKTVVIYSSTGMRDINTPNSIKFNSRELIDLDSQEKILHLPTNSKEEAVMRLVSSWENNLSSLNINISTGPVVSFRALDFIKESEKGAKFLVAPLFWLHNIKKMKLEWPVKLPNKGQYISIESDSRPILIPNKDYILLRRFSTKDDKSRLIASPYYSSFSEAEFIGVENKLNYIYRKNGVLEMDELLGMCTLLNSELFDTYFQIFNGNVNVSATELREMKFPHLHEIKEIGKEIIFTKNNSMEKVNQIVNNYFETSLILK